MPSVEIKVLKLGTGRPTAHNKDTDSLSCAKVVVGGAGSSTGETKFYVSTPAGESASTKLLHLQDDAATDLFFVQKDGAIQMGVSGKTVKVKGDFVVDGTSITTLKETVKVADNYLYVNDAYETVSAQTGGLVVNYLPTSTNDTVATGGFTAGVASTSNPTVVTTGSGTFAAGQIIQIAGANNPNNNGLFEVLSHTGTTLTIRGIGTTATVEDFTQNQFVTDTTVAGTIRRVTVAVLRAGTDGIWETASGASTGLVFADIAASPTLQQAYDNGTGGNGVAGLITTNATDGRIEIAGNQEFRVSASGGFNQTAGAHTIAASSSVTINSSGAAIQIGNNADAQGIDIGTGAAARTIVIGNQTGGTSLTLNSGTGNIDIGTTGQARSINIGTGGAAQTVTVGSGNTTSTTTVACGTGGLSLGTTANAHTVTIGSNIGASSVVIQGGTGGVSVGANPIAQTVTIGNGTGASSVVIQSGTGNIDIGANGVAHTVVIGNQTGASALTLDAGTGTISIGIGAQARTINFGTGAAVQTINIGTGAADNVITIGSTTGAASLALRSGTGNMTLTFAAGQAAALTMTDGTTSFLVLDSTGGKKINVGAELNIDSGVNITFDSQTSTFNSIQVQNIEAEVVSFTSGGVTVGDVVYFDNATSKVKPADADTFAQAIGIVGIAKETIADGSAVRVRVTRGGKVAGFSGLTPGAVYYLSQTAGAITSVAPTAVGSSVVKVGSAVSTTEIIFDSNYLYEN
jgi:hypothetical protein